MTSNKFFLTFSLVLLLVPSSAFAAKGKKVGIKVSASASGGKVSVTVTSKIQKRKISTLELQRSDGDGFFTFAEVKEPKRKETFTDESAGNGSHWYRARLIRKDKVSSSEALEVQVSENELFPGEKVVVVPEETGKPTEAPTDAAPDMSACDVSLPDGAGECPASFADEVLNIVNLERELLGLHSLTPLKELSCSSRIHTAYMVKTGVMSHDGWVDHLKSAGYNGNYAGQNVAVGFQTPVLVMQAWMASPGHKANIISSKFNHLGVGCLSFRGGFWWTQDFGS